MASGKAITFGELPTQVLTLLTTERRAVMTTVAGDGSTHSVPVVFAYVDDEIGSPIDHKPKSGQVLARVKNITRDDRVTLLIDRWDEDWAKLAWLMVRGHATVDPDAPSSLMNVLNERYEQYEADERHDALIRIRPTRLTWWAWGDV